MKRLRVALSICALCLLLVLLVAQITLLNATEPNEPAKATAVAEGWQEQDLFLMGIKRSKLFGESAEVELHVRGTKPTKAIHVRLRRPFWSVNWDVTGYDEGPAVFVPPHVRK